MLGAIAGDIIGSPYEGGSLKSTDFPLFSKDSRFTDDSVLTVATADCLMNNGDFLQYYRDYFLNYPYRGYGFHFSVWGSSGSDKPYNSWGNGSAMRVSPVGFCFDSEERVLEEAKKSAEITHNHIEGIKGAESTALAIYMARKGKSKEAIKEKITDLFEYDLDRKLDDFRESYKFEVSCQKSVPKSMLLTVKEKS